MLTHIDANTCEAVGHGARRPEDVAVSVAMSTDGAVWLSDQGGARAVVDHHPGDGPGNFARSEHHAHRVLRHQAP